MRLITVSGLVSVLLLLVSACGGDGDTSATAATTDPSPPTQVAPTSEGQRLFNANNCSACHGADGQGTAIAPGLAGHTIVQVKRQARAPLGQMPVFPPSQISNSELDQIAEYIETLEGDHVHMVINNPAQASAQHHWMALFALEDDSPGEAIHHIGHIIALVSGQHLVQMEEAKTRVEAGDLHEALHTIENMLAGVQLEDLTPSEMHAALARSSALIDDAEGALHHLDHIEGALTEGTAVSERIEEVRELLESGDFADAAHELEELVGQAHEEEHEEPEGHAH